MKAVRALWFTDLSFLYILATRYWIFGPFGTVDRPSDGGSRRCSQFLPLTNFSTMMRLAPAFAFSRGAPVTFRQGGALTAIRMLSAAAPGPKVRSSR